MDYSKYKRVFAFGCSFTHWHHPTWADIISKCCTNGEFYNLGEGGAGNIFISSRITQANLKFNFCETDLLLIMFSTPFREDRWIEGSWRLYGSIYNQPFYDKKFVRDYTDPVGLIIRDLAVVETTMAYVNSLPSDKLMFRAVDMGHSEFQLKFDDYTKYNERITNLFNNSSISKLPHLIDEDNYHRYRNYKTYKTKDGREVHDGHPLPGDYLRFLQKHNIPLTQEAIDYAIDASNFIDNTDCYEDLETKFPGCISTINDKYEIF